MVEPDPLPCPPAKHEMLCRCCDECDLPLYDGATSACWECGSWVPIEDLWVGKRSGIALCDRCLAYWTRAGRARPGSADF